MNIEGLSEATLEKFIGRGYIHEFADIFHLDRFQEEITEMEGFGEKSYQNLINSVEAARRTTLPRLIFSLGIANIGLANAKMICRHYHDDWEDMLAADVEDLSGIDGVGGVIATGFYEYFQKEENRRRWENLLKEVEIEKEEIDESMQTLSGMAFVVTGSLNHYENRKELKEAIEKRGGKVTGSVTSKTVCLINNDNTSSSSKNKKARELQIPILTEEEFIEQYLGGQSDAD